MINQATKLKARQEKPALKVMRHINTDKEGKNATITSTVSNPPKLREAVGMDPKPVKTEKPKDASKRNGIDNFDYKVLQALDVLAGKDIDSLTRAKKAGTVKTNPNPPRAPIRNAMQAFEKLGYVKADQLSVMLNAESAKHGIRTWLSLSRMWKVDEGLVSRRCPLKQ